MKRPLSIKRRKQFRRRPQQAVMAAGASGTGAAGSVAGTPSMGVEAKGTVAGEAPPPPRPQPGPETWGWQGADQTSEQIARQINQSTPQPLRLETGQQASVATEVVKATIPIVPTLYPEEPDGAVIVHNHITINIHNVEFREFNSKLDDVIRLLRISNEISGETRDQLIAEIKAGRALLAAPKPDAQLIELLLRRPLLFIGKTASGAIIGVAATAAVALLGKLTGLW